MYSTQLINSTVNNLPFGNVNKYTNELKQMIKSQKKKWIQIGDKEDKVIAGSGRAHRSHRGHQIVNRSPAISTDQHDIMNIEVNTEGVTPNASTNKTSKNSKFSRVNYLYNTTGQMSPKEQH